MLKTNTLSLLCLLLFSTYILQAQEEYSCAFTQTNKQYLQKYPLLQNKLENWEQGYTQRVNAKHLSRSNSEYNLPLVVHIIHNNGPENISNEQVSNAVAHLNQSFSNSDYFADSEGLDTGIQFCLAQQDPEGNLTEGINRVSSPLTALNSTTDDLNLKNLSRWDPEQYINIWVVKSICYEGTNCGLIGYAFLPPFHGEDFDGIVIEADYFGTGDNLRGVLAHEMGHYLGLYHTFEGACSNDDCLTDGDRVCDTPPDQSTFFTPCTQAVNSCSSDVNPGDTNNPFTTDQPDPTDNFMDYSYCMINFTAGQTGRMQDAIENQRFSLLNSSACQTPCSSPLSASFTASAEIINAGETVFFEDNSENTLSAFWFVDGALFSGESYTFEQPGDYTVSLITVNENPNCVAETSISISVLCEAQASFETSANTAQVNENIQCSNTSGGGSSPVWSLNNTVVGSGDSYTFVGNIPGVYELCLQVSGNNCESQTCQFLLVQNTLPGSEDCINGIDDDGDGLIDFYDPDCPCLTDDSCNTPYFSSCTDACSLGVSSESLTLSYETSDYNIFGFYNIMTVGDVDGDCAPDLITITGYNSDGLSVIDGVSREIKYNEADSDVPGYMCTADTDTDGESEIFRVAKPFNSSQYFLYRYDYNSSINNIEETWQSSEAIDYLPEDFVKAAISPMVADFNQDGRPEVYVGNQIFDSQTGVELVKMGDDFNRGAARRPNFFGVEESRGLKNSAVAVDILADSFCDACEGLELVAGNQVFALNIQSYNNPEQNEMSLVQELPGMSDAVTAIADFDLDGDLDIIAADYNNAYSTADIRVYVWDAQSPTFVCQPFVYQNDINPVSLFISIPAVGDTDGDGRPEIVMHGGRSISILEDYQDGGGANWGSSTTQTFQTLSTNDEAIGVGLFDFELDGAQEIFFRNADGLFIFDGDLNQKAFEPLSASSVSESPIVADIDNDNQAELVTWGGTPSGNGFDQFLIVFESAGTPWPNTRKVWNQYSFFNVNIDENGRIPPVQQQQQLVGSGTLNSFNQQYAYGPPPEAEASVNIVIADCTEAGTEIIFSICNEGQNTLLPPDLTFSVYEGDPTQTDAPLLFTETTDIPVAPEECQIFIRLIEEVQGSVYIAVNDPGDLPRPYNPTTDLALSAFNECNYLNNIDGMNINVPSPPELDLGPDISICENGVFVLDAGDDFAEYFWFDGSNGTSNTVFNPGIYWVETTDYCGTVQRDSLEIIIDPLTTVNLGDDITVCPEESLSFSVGNFDTYSWLVNGESVCLDCPTFDLSTTEDVELIINVGSNLGCFDSDTLQISIQAASQSFDTLILCEQDTLTIDGVSIFSDTLLQQVFTSNSGCDSIVSTEVQVLPSVQTEELITACEGDSLFFLGDIITESQVINQTLTGSNGCDSLRQTTFNFLENIFTEETLNLCAGDTVIVFGEALSETQTIAQTFTAESGCDSTHTVNLSFNEQIMTSESPVLCEGDTAFVLGASVTSDTLLTGSFTAVSGCDSIHQVSVSFAENIATFEAIDLCEGESAEVFGTNVTTPQTLTESFIAANACDSTHTVTVNFSPLLFTEEDFVLCAGDSMTVFGDVITEDATLSQTFTALSTCDSTHTVNIIFLEAIFTQEEIFACMGDTLTVFGEVITQTESLSETSSAQSGCDSTHVVNIFFTDEIQTEENLTACAGESLIIFGEEITESGVFSQTYTTSTGCDSTHTVNVEFFEGSMTEEEIFACSGETIVVFGESVSSSQVLSQNFTSSTGCDSVHTVSVLFSEAVYTSTEYNLCAGDTITLFGNPISESTVLTEIFTAANTCDSIVEVNVNVLEEIEFYSEVFLCPGEFTEFFGQSIASPGTYFETTGGESENCDTLYILEVNIPEAIDYLLPEVITTVEGQVIELPLQVNTDNVSIQWSPAEQLSCDTCVRPLVRPFNNQSFQVELSDEQGCTELASIDINVQKRESIYLPNAFSPDNDGINDTFVLYANSRVSNIHSAAVYDRWGTLLLNLQDLSPTEATELWDGNFRGSPAPTGVYVYVLELEYQGGRKEVIKGDVTLLR